MRKLWRKAALVVALSCVLAALGGCAGRPATAPAEMLAAPAGGFAIPLPQAMRQVSAGQLLVHGNEYQEGWAHSRVQRVLDKGRFSPDYTSAHRAIGDAAYALYAFNVLEYAGDQVLHIYYSKAGAQGSAWVGLPGYVTGRWDWQLLDDPVQYHCQLPLNLAGRSKEGILPIALVFLSDQVWELSKMYLGLTAEPGAWPMAGNNARGNFSTDSLGAQSPNLLWEYHSSGPGTPISSLALAPDGTLLVAAGEYVAAYNSSGEHLWTCNSISPNSGIGVALDGSSYIGGRWPNKGVHAITPQGALKWTIHGDQEIYSTPAVGLDGNIYFCADDRFFYCVRLNGSQVWKVKLAKPSRIGPAISNTGVAYAAYLESSVSDTVGYLTSVSPQGDVLWDVTVGNPPRHRLCAAVDGGVLFTSKSGTLSCINADGTERWTAGGVASPWSWPVTRPDGTIYTLGDALYAYDVNGVELWKAAVGGTGMGAPALMGNGHLAGCTLEGSVFECTAEGSLSWSIPVGYEIYTGVAAASGVVYVGDIERNLRAYNSDGSTRWQGGAGGAVLCSPVVAGDGTLYFGSEDTYLYALWPDGRLKWRYATGGAICGSPLIGYDGTIYVASQDGKLHALNASGEPLWQYATGNLLQSSPVQDDYGNIYFGSHDYYFYSLTADGSLRWRYHTDWNVTASAAVEQDGTVYFGSWDGNVYCLDSSGELVWQYLTVGPVKGSVTYDEDYVYCASEDTTLIGRIYAIEKDTGKKEWSYLSGGPMQMGPALGMDGLVYSASNMAENLTGGTLYCCLDDRLQWAYPAPSVARGLALDRDRVVYVGTRTGKVLALQDINNTLNILWKYERPGSIFYTPAIANERLYIGCDTGVIALGAN